MFNPALWGAVCFLTLALMNNRASSNIAEGSSSNTTTIRVADHQPLRGFRFKFTAPPLSEDPVSIQIRVQTHDVVTWSWENLDPSNWVTGSGDPCGYPPRAALLGTSLVEHGLYSSNGERLKAGPWGAVNVGPYHTHGFYSGCSAGGAPPLAPFDGVLDGSGFSGWTYQCPGSNCVVENSGGLVEDVTYTIYWYALDARHRAAWRRGYPLSYQPNLSFLNADVPWSSNHSWLNASDFKATVDVSFTAQF